ncbi:MAG: GerMN domain-containing protein [Ruminococcus sp.]|nr:GerMN domain-containing protein [Ruminococcus sp.]
MKKRGMKICLGILGISLCLLSACAKKAKPVSGTECIYCLNSEGTGLVEVEYEIVRNSPEETVSSILNGLSKPAEDLSYMPAIPEDVKVDAWRMEHAIVYLDFNAAYLEMPALKEKLTRAAIVRSLTRQEEISGVCITVEQEILRNEAGKPLGVMNEDDFVQSTGASPSSYEKTTLTLYFANEDGSKLVSQQMDVKYNSNISKEKLIMEKLMSGPKSGAFPTVNPDAALLGATMKDGICYVNFDAEFLNSVYDIRPEIAIYSIVNSLVEGTSAGKVQITVNGEKSVMYQETVDLSQPLSRDLSWEEEEETEEPSD